MIATSSVARRRVREGPRWTTTLDVPYSGALGLDVYKPALSPRPAVIFVHGGGWTGNDKSDDTPLATQLAAYGFAVFNINYTLTLGVPQTLINNVLASVTFVRNNAATYNVDASRVYMIGKSAGGHLALMAAITGVAGGSRPDKVCAWSPPCELGTLVGYGAGAAENYMGNTYVGNETAWQAKSPRQQVSSNCCPIRIVGSANEDTANGGIQQSQYDNMQTAAQGAGVTVAKTIYAGTVHAAFENTVETAATRTWLLGL